MRKRRTSCAAPMVGRHVTRPITTAAERAFMRVSAVIWTTGKVGFRRQFNPSKGAIGTSAPTPKMPTFYPKGVRVVYRTVRRSGPHRLRLGHTRRVARG
jgi:hypothetical protein